MAEHVIRLPDVGEGVAEAELVEWHVKVGDLVREDAILGAVMTDKATVEIPSPVEGKVLWLGANVGDVVAVGSNLVRLDVVGEEGEGAAVAPAPAAVPSPKPKIVATAPEPAPVAPPAPATERAAPSRPPLRQALGGGAPRAEGEKPLAAPAVRLRAREAGIDLRQVVGTGPAGRITHEDLDAVFAKGPEGARVHVRQARTAVEDIKVVGMRRRIAEKMSAARSIPHITYVEEIDVTAVEELRAALNAGKRQDQPRLSFLPFLMRAMVRAIDEQPNLNAHFDDEAGIIHQHAGVHIGIAAQTPTGLMVPVVKHAEALDLWGMGAELNRLAEAAKAGVATREELTGSTITITSLGAMGGVVTTPIINHPEVAIVGVNKMMTRPVWDGATFIPRKMMNLSSSFDHRVIDGWDAAVFIQRIKTLLETPAMIFIES
ncbi:dihydrolipoamide acetyltransferase family protein [Microvirga brassicacearum]|uniref:Dihydrolipoamide acetyltransferase component of pyruvate dehydrogenase complex n=1 Tax=Microvirga brassicacearum TaxID=2580413 RepID=A0A5N3PI70_9HYPH|nr:dihydrolipoamide acetyltransferase family protein [Microvirga brassicacearum]KAB0269440.1 2-oxo acid dehydrogenase subunit E2 [Microvirga brassicacearum]